MADTYQNTAQWLKAIQKMTGLPGNQSPAQKAIAEVPAATRPVQAEVTPPPTDTA